MVSIFAFVLVLVAMAAIFLHLNAFSETEETFFISNLEYAFVDGNKEDGSPVYVTNAVGLGGKNIVVPSSVEGHPVQKIAENAFRGNTQITTLTVNGDVLIEKGAFESCPNLTTVNLNGVTTIGQNAFADCDNLTTFTATGARVVGNNALAKCGSLKEVTFKDPANIQIQFNGAPSPYISTTSKHRLTSAVCYCKQHDRQRASPFSQKSFVIQNLFGSPIILKGSFV